MKNSGKLHLRWTQTLKHSLFVIINIIGIIYDYNFNMVLFEERIKVDTFVGLMFFILKINIILSIVLRYYDLEFLIFLLVICFLIFLLVTCFLIFLLVTCFLSFLFVTCFLPPQTKSLKT